MSVIPSGTVTFLFTDIEGSTKRWEQYPQAMSDALARHDEIMRAAVEANGGHVFKTVGDAFCVGFTTAHEAMSAALDAQRALSNEHWGETGPLQVRMALHTGAAEMRDDDYFGQPLNRVARILSAGHGSQVLLSLATQELVRDALPPAATLRDLGEHHLKDLFRPERIFQLVTPDLPSEFPPLKTLDNRPNNLPIQATPLIGREKEVAEVCATLRHSDVRLLTLTGTGGTGKTRVALQAAAELVDDFPDGVFFVALAPISDPGLVISTVAQAIGVKEIAGRPLLDALKDYLRDKQTLLLLDNFEQVIEAAPQVAELTQATPRLKVLVTSRAALHLYGEHEYPVPPLALPDHKHLPPLERLTQYEAVRLFIERAQAVKPDFAVTNDNAPAVAEICARLDGLPLAIELAAARVKFLPPQAMLTRLQSRLKLLTGGARDLPARQQTLRSTIEWSYDLLNEEEKMLFRRLAVFVGGCTSEAAEAVCDDEGDLGMDVLAGLMALVDKSLVKQEEVGGEPRFWMLETIREYALERLGESGEAEVMRQHHVGFFLELAERAEPDLRRPKQAQRSKRLEIEIEYDNLRAALQWGLISDDMESISRLGGALWAFWNSHDHISEGRKWLEIALARSNSTLPKSVRAKALKAAGNLAFKGADYEHAKLLQDESLALYRDLRDKDGISAALNNLGLAMLTQGDYQQAKPLFEESLVIERESGDKYKIAGCLLKLGQLARQQGDYAAARSLLEESVALFREGAEFALIWALRALGEVTLCEWDPIAASLLYEECSRIFQAVGSPEKEYQLNGLGDVARYQGNYDKARSLFEESLAIARAGEHIPSIALSLSNLGHVEHQQGEYEQAAAHLMESLSLFKQLGTKRDIAICLAGLAGVAGSQKQPVRAARLFAASEALIEAIGSCLDPPYRVEYEHNVSAAHAQLDEATWQVAWEEGRAMTMEQAIAYALEGTGES